MTENNQQCEPENPELIQRLDRIVRKELPLFVIQTAERYGISYEEAYERCQKAAYELGRELGLRE